MPLGAESIGVSGIGPHGPTGPSGPTGTGATGPTGATGSGGGTDRLLASVVYAVAAQYTPHDITVAGNPGAIDAANLTVAGTVPASGKVAVRIGIQLFAKAPTSAFDGRFYLGLQNHVGGAAVGPWPCVYEYCLPFLTGDEGNPLKYISISIPVTGLTPSAAFAWDLADAFYAQQPSDAAWVTSASKWVTGDGLGVDNQNEPDWPPGFMEVWAL